MDKEDVAVKMNDGYRGLNWRLCRTLAAFLLTVFLIAMSSPGWSAEIDDTYKWAWGTNGGWINHKATHGQATVYADHLEGYAWAENIGWVRLGTYAGGDAHTYLNTAAGNYGVNNDGAGNLSGFGWSTNAGWVNFKPTHGGVTIDLTTGDFSGYAWSENAGWIRFAGTAQDTIAYRVKTDPTTYTVKGTAGAGGAIDPSERSVIHGDTTFFTVTPDTGYGIASVTGCGGSLSSSTYTTGPITGDCTVSAAFSLNVYTLTVAANPPAGGTVTKKPDQSDYNHGTNVELTATVRV